MDLPELLAAVDRAFLVTGAGLPGWPDPRPDGRPPSQEEYSRAPDPGKYRLLGARADAWVAALEELGLGAAREVPVGAEGRKSGRAPASRAVEVRPTAGGALPLRFLHWEPDGRYVAMVEVRVAEPPLLVTSAPDCGCDACDDGSQRQLQALDEAIVPLVAGDWFHLEAPGGTVTAAGQGWSASGRWRRGEVARLVEEARAGRSRHRVTRAGRWW